MIHAVCVEASDSSLVPASPAWQIDELKNWLSIAPNWLNDHRSSVPLKKRPPVPGIKTMVFHSQPTSGQKSQGYDNYHHSVFSAWNLADVLVNWAGSSDEGIIVPPPVYMIEQGHENGVPVFGVVNLQPEKYGGDYSNLVKLLEKNEEDGSFPNANRLIAIAQSLGFDGWFINQETGGGVRDDAIKMAEFLRYFQLNAPAHINIIWYDAMIKNGDIDYQGALTNMNTEFYRAAYYRDKKGLMMIDYRWVKEKLMGASHLASAKDEPNLFYGIDAHRSKQFYFVYEELADIGKNMALFASNWHFDEKASPDINYDRANEYWHGSYYPGWPGICSFIRSRPVITRLPFKTDFNLGQGNYYYHKGNQHGVLNSTGKGWTQPQQQTPMPDYCWPSKNDDPVVIYNETGLGYQGSGALQVQGISSKVASGQLFSADYLLEGSEYLDLTYMNTNVETAWLKLQFSTGNPKIIELPECYEYWCNQLVHLNNEAGRKLCSIGVVLPENFDEYPLYLGQLRLLPGFVIMAAPPFIWSSEEQFYKNRRQFRLNWTQTPEARHYLLFTLGDDNKPDLFIGQTSHTSWVVDIPENLNAKRISVTAVSEEGTFGEPGIIDL